MAAQSSLLPFADTVSLVSVTLHCVLFNTFLHVPFGGGVGLLWGPLTNLAQTFVRCQQPFEGPQTPFNQQKRITHMFDKGLGDSCLFVITIGAVDSVCLCELGGREGELFSVVYYSDFFTLLSYRALVLELLLERLN